MAQEPNEPNDPNDPDFFDLESLINNNPLINLSGNYKSKIIKRIKECFTEKQQIWFVINNYMYLKYNPLTDFVVDLDKIYKELGFGKKSDCKNLLTNNFKENIDYIIINEKNKIVIEENDKVFAAASSAAKKPTETRGGSNRETILLNIYCFKLLCLKAKTKKSHEIHEYYVKLENIMNEMVIEETVELRKQLMLKDQELISLKEKTMITAYHQRPIIYLAYVEENVIKFGYTNDIKTRINEHKKQIGLNFKLEWVIESIYNREIEQMIKDHMTKHRITKEYLNKNQTELIQLNDELTIDKLIKRITMFKDSFKHGEMIIKLLDENELLKQQLHDIKLSISDDKNGKFIYILKTNKTDEYIIDLTDDENISYDCYKTENAKKIKQMAYLLLNVNRINDNTFKMAFDKLKTVVEYSIMAYDHFRIHINDVTRFNNLYNYVTRNPEDKLILKKLNILIEQNIYQEYINEKIEFGLNYKVALIMLYEDFQKWYTIKYPKSNLKLTSIHEKDLKDDISKNFSEITGCEKTFVNMFNFITKKNLSSYPGFIGIRLKENNYKTNLLEEEIYKDYINKHIEYTGVITDLVHRKTVMDSFVDYINKNYEITKEENDKIRSPTRYMQHFLHEFVTMFKKLLNIEYYDHYRIRIDSKHLHGCFKMIKFKNES